MRYTGIVQKGGRTAGELGFPTANIPLTDEKVSGVYAATVKIGDEEYESVVFADNVKKVLEAHVLDFEADLYGWNISVELLEKIRDRRKFVNDTVTKEWLEKDTKAVRAYFEKRR